MESRPAAIIQRLNNVVQAHNGRDDIQKYRQAWNPRAGSQSPRADREPSRARRPSRAVTDLVRRSCFSRCPTRAELRTGDRATTRRRHVDRGAQTATRTYPRSRQSTVKTHTMPYKTDRWPIRTAHG